MYEFREKNRFVVYHISYFTNNPLWMAQSMSFTTNTWFLAAERQGYELFPLGHVYLSGVPSFTRFFRDYS